MKEPLKLHLGCGGRHFEGYINIDLIKRGPVDMVADVRNLPLQDSSVGLIEAYHLIEHIPRYEVLPMLKEWFRVLISKGKIIAEFPDFDRSCQIYLKQGKMLGVIFGGQRWPSDVHYFGYNFKRLKELYKRLDLPIL